MAWASCSPRLAARSASTVRRHAGQGAARGWLSCGEMEMMDVGHTLMLTLFIALGVLSAAFIFWWARSVRAARDDERLPNESGPSSAPTLVQYVHESVRSVSGGRRGARFVNHAAARRDRDELHLRRSGDARNRQCCSRLSR